jgi:cell division protein FtsL
LKNVEFINQQEEQKELSKLSVKEFLTGRILSKERMAGQLPFIVFLGFLAFIYIANRFHAERLVRKNMELQQEVKELRAESITTASELMFLSRQSQLFKMIQSEGLSLKESVVPPARIKMRD